MSLGLCVRWWGRMARFFGEVWWRIISVSSILVLLREEIISPAPSSMAQLELPRKNKTEDLETIILTNSGQARILNILNLLYTFPRTYDSGGMETFELLHKIARKSVFPDLPQPIMKNGRIFWCFFIKGYFLIVKY